MEHETRRLQTLIEDLFTLARAEVSKLELRCVPADVGEEVRRIAEMVAPLAWQSGRVEVVAEVAPGLPLALVDSNRLNQVLQNLLHNGIRHTPPGGIVAISASADRAACHPSGEGYRRGHRRGRPAAYLGALLSQRTARDAIGQRIGSGAGAGEGTDRGDGWQRLGREHAGQGFVLHRHHSSRRRLHPRRLRVTPEEATRAPDARTRQNRQNRARDGGVASQRLRHGRS